jgi:hypothetical protein
MVMRAGLSGCCRRIQTTAVRKPAAKTARKTRRRPAIPRPREDVFLGMAFRRRL